MRCLLSSPRLALELPEDILDARHSSSEALLALVSFARSAPEASVAAIIDRFRDTPYGAALVDAQIGLLEMQIDPENLEIEFRDGLKQLRSDIVKGQIRALEQKERLGGLSGDEAAEYSRLIKEFAKLKQPGENRANMV
jgi:DNA primase